ncbi:MAG: hypothetical protein CM1200mP29_00710 [Verrucomicrobiota bacterium]|nr:MAG: hypothetical protein CM1200mP29_00710 [Verrucomicrobiota bacterium]
MPPAGKNDRMKNLQNTPLRTRKLARKIAAQHPQPGQIDTLRRLNRTEYRNAIRDLLVLDIDAAALLPADESSHGFDNITVGDLSPTLLNRYIIAAQKISRLAVGVPRKSPEGHTIRIPPDPTQEEHVPGLPLGTRGGTLIPYTFPQDGEYEIQIHLTRDRNEHVEGLSGTHELELLLDRERLKVFTVKKPKKRNDHTKLDAHLKTAFKSPPDRATSASPLSRSLHRCSKPSDSPTILISTAIGTRAFTCHFSGFDHRPLPGYRPQ